MGPILEEEEAPLIDKCVSIGQLNLDCLDAGDSLVSSRLSGAILGLIPGRNDGLNLAGEGGVRFLADILDKIGENSYTRSERCE